MEEILNAVLYEIENSGYYERLSAGIVITGGGALLKDLPQLVKFITGMDVRLGYPSELLASESVDDVNNPMFSTSVGLILKGWEFMEQNKEHFRDKEKVDNEVSGEEMEDEEEQTEIHNRGFIGRLKQAFNDIFEENDAEM